MSYDDPTPHELRISRNLQKVAADLKKSFRKRTGGECDFVLSVVSKAENEKARGDTLHQAPVGSYISTMERESAALSMCELLSKWQMRGEMRPIHELRDAEGRSLKDILEEGEK